MNGRVSKVLRKLVVNENPAILVAVRDYCGEKTENMDDLQIYRTVKKLYKNGFLRKYFQSKEQTIN